MERVLPMLNRLFTRVARARLRHELYDLDDRLLADVGLVREESHFRRLPPLVEKRKLQLPENPPLGARAGAREILVRDAAVHDMPAIAGIYAHHVLHGLASFEEAAPSVEDMTSRWSAVAQQAFPYLVAEREGRVVGYSYAASYRPRPAYRYAVEDSVYVAPDLAGQGIGRALLRALIERCERGAWRQMIAVIGDSGNAGSIALHRSLGFRPVGTLRSVGFKFGRWVDSVIMQRELGAGAHTLPSQPEATAAAHTATALKASGSCSARASRRRILFVKA
jgi:L-amino acid N-acyltransferase YncA